MKTHLGVIHQLPDFDAKIVEWIPTFDYTGYDGPVLRVGIVGNSNEAPVIYRAIDGMGAGEMACIYEFLESIGLIDLGLYEHPRFNCIYGLPEHRCASHERMSVSCFG